MKFFILLCGIACWHMANAQKSQLTVTIIDEYNQPVLGAALQLETYTGRPASGSPPGTYLFKNVVHGRHKLVISKAGFQAFQQTILFSNQNDSLFVTLRADPHVLEDIVIQNYTDNQRKSKEQLNLEIVKSDFIQKNLGGSLMQSLERLPGVKNIGIGSGQSKPLIRGLGFNRVVVIDKGIKHEGQQWGADHGLEIDQFAATEIEVLKGAASFAYGSDAIAGAINIKSPGTPSPHTLGGEVTLIGKSNNKLYGTSINLYGRAKNWFATGRFTMQQYGDYRVPADSLFVYDYAVHLHKNHLRNTAGKELNLHSSIGYINNRIRSVFYIDNNFSKSGFFANAHGLEPRRVDAALHDRSSRDIQSPYQQVNHFKIINRTHINFNHHSLEAEAGFQNNYRKEYNHYVNHGYMPPNYPETMTTPIDLERLFNKNVYAFNLKDLIQFKKHDLQIGVNGEIQQNTIGGWSFLVPSFNQHAIGVFAYDKLYLNERTILHGAIRYDYTNVHIKSYTDWFTSPIEQDGNLPNQVYITRAERTTRNFNSVTGSVGVNYNVGNIELKGSMGKSYRVPIAKELAANGVNYHYFSYEKGNTTLAPEESYQIDATAIINTHKWRIQASPFFNYFPNYIYLNPTANHDYTYGAGNQVFEYTQSKVLRYGGELQIKYNIGKTLSTELLGEYLYARQLSGAKKGYSLPFSPPASLLFNLSYEPRHTGVFKRTYISVDYRITAAQKNIVPPERKTNSYSVLHIQAGSRFYLQNQEASLSLQLQNVLNTRYMIHTSFYRLIGLPEQGRNLVISLKIPFNFLTSKKTI